MSWKKTLSLLCWTVNKPTFCSRWRPYLSSKAVRYINILERKMMPLLARHADLKEIYRNLRVYVFVNIYQSYTTICVYTAICTSKTKRSYKTNKKRIKCEKIKGNRKTGILCYTISSYILIRLSLIRARKLFLLTIVSLALTMHVLNLFIK